MSKKKEIAAYVKQLSEGLLAHATDFILFTLFLVPASIGVSKTSRGAHITFTRAGSMLAELNYETIKRAIRRLQEKGWLKENLRITKAGQERITGIVPLQALRERERKWDGRWRLVIFDIPEKKRGERDVLRVTLHRLRFAQLQKSIWVSAHPYLGDVRSIIKERRLDSYVMLAESDALGREGSRALAERLWSLAALNSEYRTLLKKRGSIFEYLWLLSRDPFCPLALLPSPWYGAEAHARYEKALHKI